MKWRRNVRLSLRALARSPLRTGLSVGGVAIGIASVVVLLGAGEGAERALRRALEPLGKNLLVVNAARTRTGALRGASRAADTLTPEDGEAISREVAGVLRTAALADRQMPVTAHGRAVSSRVTGTTPEFAVARNFPLVAGRFIDEDDLRESQRVAVVGPMVVAGLFAGESPLGATIQVGGVPFRVVGATRSKGIGPNGANEDELVIIPLTTAMRRLFDVESLDRIYVQAESEAATAAARAEIARLLRRRHALAPGAPDDFDVQDQTAIVRAQREVGGPLARLVPALAAVALLLGGVGLLAVSLLSVRERTAEIGLRLAVGGRPRDVLLQFLTEAVLISALGGLAGLAAGAVGITLGGALTRWPMALAWQAVVYPFFLSMAIAVLFGAYPALRAARLDPIQALNSR